MSGQHRGTPDSGEATQQRMLASTAVMAAGTVVSRLSGFLRSALLAAALGLGLHADLFNIANTIPNTLYILLAGGVFNAVLVPQLVRAQKQDADGGAAYTDRVVTAATLFLAAVTVLLVVAAPLVMDLYLSRQFHDPALAAQRSSAIDFARWCLPQVFFYGMYVLVGQILNARGRFGPMMWAPIANNVISVTVLVVYLLRYGPIDATHTDAAFGSGQEMVLGLGSTLGIAAQLLILIPYLRSAGVRIRPRFDLRDSGLGHTLRLGIWTVLFVVVNQITYTVVVRLASGGVAGADDGTGYSVYSMALLVVMVPHSVITVSLATAALPTLSARAHAGDEAGLARTLAGTLRTALAVMLPFAAVLPFVAADVSRLLLHGAAADSVGLYAPVLAMFGPGIVMFTVHYVILRGFYALELNRAVFTNQCFVAAVNIAVAVVLVHQTGSRHTALSLTVAYLAAYCVGALLSYSVLSRRVGDLDDADTTRFIVRVVLAVAGATLVAGGLATLADHVMATPSWPVATARAGVIVGVEIVGFLALARVLHLREVTAVIATITRRVR